MIIDLPWTQIAWLLCTLVVCASVHETLEFVLPYAERAHERHCQTALEMTEMEYGYETDDDEPDPEPDSAPVVKEAEIVDLNARRVA